MKVALHDVAARHTAASAAAAAALSGVTLTVARGEQVAVIGPSGAGKTTLLQVVAATSPPSQGTLALDGRNPWALPRRALQRLRGRLFLAPQTPPLPPRQRVVTALLAGRLPAQSLWAALRSLFYPDDIAAAHAALLRFDLPAHSVTRDMLARLYGSEFEQLNEPPAATAASPDATTRQPVVVHCR